MIFQGRLLNFIATRRTSHLMNYIDSLSSFDVIIKGSTLSTDFDFASEFHRLTERMGIDLIAIIAP